MNDQLKKYRLEKDMTQQQVADMIGVDRTTYTLYENGKVQPSLEKMKAIARVFEVPLMWLLEPQTSDASAMNPAAMMLGSKDWPDDLSDAVDDYDFFLHFRMLTKESKAQVLELMRSLPMRPEFQEPTKKEQAKKKKASARTSKETPPKK